MTLTSMFRTEIAMAMVVALAFALLLLALRPKDRASTRTAILLLGLAAIIELADNLVRSMGWGTAAAIAADVASVLIGAVLIRLVTIFFFRIVLAALRIEPARIAEDLVTAGLLVGWGFTWLRLSGVDFASLVTSSAVVTAVIAFAMQETLGNVLGGVVLQLERSIKVGDWVRIDDFTGRVIEVRWRHTAILTRNGETMIVPNGWMMKNRVMVIASPRTGPTLWRRWVRVNVDLSAQPTRVCMVMENAVKNAEIPHVSAQPEPSAVLMDIGPRHGAYALRYWIDDPGPDDATDSRVRAHVLAALARHGMKLGAPYQEELSLQDDEAHRAAIREQDLARRRGALARAKIFSTLTETETATLAHHLVDAPFVAGATLTRQGAVAHWLYIVASGEVDVWYESPDGQRTPVARLSAGSVFGEMGMMTGEARRATVTAHTDVDCYRLDKEGFANILRQRPDIAQEMSQILAERETQLQGRREAAANVTMHKAVRRKDILERIRAFFGLDTAEEDAPHVRES